jgi:hypothetical protein
LVAWLWSIAVTAAIVLSVGLAIIGLASTPEALIMLPLELQPGIPPSAVSRLFLGLMMVAFVAFYGSLIILLFLTSWIHVVVWGVVLFFAHHGRPVQNWRVRNTNCQRMKPMLLWSAVLIVLIIAASVNTWRL